MRALSEHITRLAVVGMAVSMITLIAVPAGAGEVFPPGGSFVDDDGNTHEGMIERIAARGITFGCEPALYCPTASVTRGQMASFLARAFSLPAPSDDHFDDDSGSTHEDNINRIYEAGISTGFADGTYRPDVVVSRAQMGSFLARAVGLTAVASGPFVDVSGVHAGNINAIYEAGITTGCALGATYYCPDDPVRRDQMASFLGRALDLEPIAVPPRDWDIAISALDAAAVPVGIHVVNANTGATTVATTDVDAAPLWSPDKSRIAFHRLFADLFTDPTLGEDFVPPVHAVEADGSMEYGVGAILQAEGEGTGSFNFSWGPSGTLAVDAGFSFAGTERDLWVADIDAGTAAELASDAAWWLTDPKWSHGGDYIAVHVGDGLGGESIRVFDSVSGMELVDFAEPAGLFNFTWTPGAETLVLHLSDDVMPPGNELLLWDVAFADGIPVFIPGAGNVDGFAVSPDGDDIAYVSNVGGDFDVYVINVASELVTQITTTAGIDESSPVWSPDGTMLAFERSGGVHIVVGETGTVVGTITEAQDPDW